MKHTSKTQTLLVTGRPWGGGGEGYREYSLHVIGQPELEGVEPKTLPHVKLIACDFETITSAQLITTTTTTEIKKKKLKLT